jgi:hypothetical protein
MVLSSWRKVTSFDYPVYWYHRSSNETSTIQPSDFDDSKGWSVVRGKDDTLTYVNNATKAIETKDPENHP